MNELSSRRQFLGLCGAAALAALPVRAFAEAPLLDAQDPMAKALGYVAKATSIDPKKEASFKPGSNCAGCTLYAKAQEKGGHAPCGAVGGKRVAGAGWCRAWVA